MKVWAAGKTHTQVFRHIYFQVYTSNVSLLCQHHTSGCVLINTINWVFEEVDKTRHKNIWYWLTFSVFRWCISVLQLTQKTCGHKQPWVIVCLNVCAGKQLRLVLILLKLFDCILWQLLVRWWGGNKCRLLIREKKTSILQLKQTLGCFPFGSFPMFSNFMTHRQVSNTHGAVAEYPKTLYWLNPPCLLARCPISCQNSRKLSSPSLFLSSELIRWSMAVGSPAFCREKGKILWNTKKQQQRESVWTNFDAIGWVSGAMSKADTTST